MREASAWMPLYVGDYLADTMHLSTVEHGAYLLLIMAYWKRGGPLPADDRALAAITRMPLKRWISTRSTLIDMFQNGEGCWRHRRIDLELERSRAFMAKQLENGRKGGRPPKPKDNPDETHGLGLANPGPNPNVTPSQSQSQSPSTENQKKDLITTEIVSSSLGNGKHLNGNGLGTRARGAIDWNVIVARMLKHGFDAGEAWSIGLRCGDRPDLAKRIQGAMRAAEAKGRTARQQIETIAASVA